MKKLSITILLVAPMCSFAQSSHYVNPHTKANGTYVQGHYQTNPNATKMDNYSTQGNTNPYTGQAGTVDPYKQSPSNSQPKQPSCGYTQAGKYVCN
jgi:hypothetical protein